MGRPRGHARSRRLTCVGAGALLTVTTVGFGVAVPARAEAATGFTWTGSAGDGLWATPGNWAGNAAPSGSGLTVTIGTSTATVDNVPGLGIADLVLANAAGGSLSGQAVSVAAIDLPQAGSWQVSDNLVLIGTGTGTTTQVSPGAGGTLTLAGVLSGTSGLRTVGATATTALTGAGANTFTGVLEAAEGVITLGKTAGVQAFGGTGQASSFNPTGTLRWLADDQAPPNAVIGTDGENAVIDLNGHNDTVARVSDAAGTVETGAGTLTVTQDLHNNNTSGSVTGHLAVPSNASVTVGDGDLSVPSTSDNNLDITATLDIPSGATVQVRSEGATTLTGGDAQGAGSGGGGTLELYRGQLGVDGEFARTSVHLDTGTTASVGGHVRELEAAAGSFLTPSRSPSGSPDDNPLDVDGLAYLVGHLEILGQPHDSIDAGEVAIDGGATLDLNSGDPEAPFTVLHATDGSITGTFAGLPQGAQLPHSSLSVSYTNTLVRLVAGGSTSTIGTTFTWTGGGDGVSWSDAGNWQDGAAPTAGDAAATVTFPASLGGATSTDDVPGFAPSVIQLDASTGDGASLSAWSVSGTVIVPDTGLTVDTGPRPSQSPGGGEGGGGPVIGGGPAQVDESLTAALTGNSGSVTYQGGELISVAPDAASSYGGSTFALTGVAVGAGSVPGDLTVGHADGRLPLNNGVAGPTVTWLADGVLPSYADLIVERDGAVTLGAHSQTVGTLELTGISTSAAGGGLTVTGTIAYTGSDATIVGDLTLSGDLTVESVGGNAQLSVQATLHGNSSTAELVGPGVVTLAGDGDFTGNLTVEDGVTLSVGGSVPGAQLDLRSGGVVGGSGTVGTLYDGGTLETGLHAGDVIIYDGTLEDDSGQPLTATSLSLQGGTTLTVGTNVGPPTTVVSITGGAPPDGTFDGLAQGAQTAATRTSYISYCAGVTLTAAPVSCGGVVVVGTTTGLTVSPSPAAAGQTVTLTAAVTASDGNTPSGQVAFTDGGVSLGEARPLTGGSATLTTDSLATGSHQLAAHFTGTGFAASDSPTVPLTVTQAPTVTLAPGTVVYSRHASHTGTGLTPDAVWTRTSDGTDTVLEAHARDPRLSADGTKLFFRRGSQPDGYADQLWVRDLASGTETSLYTTTATVVGYDAVGNSGLVFDQACRLNVLALAGGAPNQLGTGSTCGSVAPAESRDQSHLAVTDAAGLSVASTTGTGVRTHVGGTVAADISPSWSPDGATLAFLRPQPGTTTRYDVWTVPAAGGTPTRLTALLDADALGPALPWSGDGSAVVSAGRVYGVFGLWRIPTAGGDPQLLPTTAGDPLTYVGAVVGGSSGTVAAPAPVATSTAPTVVGRSTGQPLTLTAMVTAASGLVVRGGTVTFTEGTATLGSGPVVEGAVTVALPGGLGAGGHTIAAGYAGTPVFALSSGSTDVTITPTITPSVAPKAAAQPAVLHAVATAWTADAATSRAWAPVTCPKTGCSGTVNLTAMSHGHVVTVGTAHFTLRRGGRHLVLVHLSRAGARLLAATRRTRLRVVIRMHRHLVRTLSIVFAPAPRSAR